MQRKWTPAEDDTLAELRQRGLSFGECSRVLGRSRSSCAARVWRLAQPPRPVRPHAATEQPFQRPPAIYPHRVAVNVDPEMMGRIKREASGSLSARLRELIEWALELEEAA
jgi:hypothetical protein